MTKQSTKSEQITPSLEIVYDYDQTMTTMDEFESAFSDALGNIEVVDYKNVKIRPIRYTHDNHDTYFLTGAITWLSNPHPLFKKRLQLKKWYKEFYDEYNCKDNTDVRIVGVYRYNGIHIFVEFNAQDYMQNKLNSSSAHVYSKDLCQALISGYFRKHDDKENEITTIYSQNFKEYIDEEM